MYNHSFCIGAPITIKVVLHTTQELGKGGVCAGDYIAHTHPIPILFEMALVIQLHKTGKLLPYKASNM